MCPWPTPSLLKACMILLSRVQIVLIFVICNKFIECIARYKFIEIRLNDIDIWQQMSRSRSYWWYWETYLTSIYHHAEYERNLSKGSDIMQKYMYFHKKQWFYFIEQGQITKVNIPNPKMFSFTICSNILASFFAFVSCRSRISLIMLCIRHFTPNYASVGKLSGFNYLAIGYIHA